MKRKRIRSNLAAYRAERLKRLIIRDEDLVRTLSGDRPELREPRAQAKRRLARNKKALASI